MDQETEQIAKEIASLSNEPLIDIKISELAAWCLIVQIQCAVRHPANTGTTANQARTIANDIQSRLELPPTLENLTRRGWLPEYDAIPSESNEEYLSRVPRREIIEVHNVYTIYSSEDEGHGLMRSSRPQDWGNQKLWAYKRFQFECIQEKKHFINHAHCWYNPKHIPEIDDVFMTFGQAIAMIAMPGKPEQLCSNRFLGANEFWYTEWGEMPPLYLPDELFEEPPDELD
ncbi:MAG: hypothetical protein QNJ36_16815 [Calothrix sp. MO_167.B42]|nr:hypothetical protein [Calothrix sp. MO_167.B42]